MVRNATTETWRRSIGFAALLALAAGLLVGGLRGDRAVIAQPGSGAEGATEADAGPSLTAEGTLVLQLRDGTELTVRPPEETLASALRVGGVACRWDDVPLLIEWSRLLPTQAWDLQKYRMEQRTPIAPAERVALARWGLLHPELQRLAWDQVQAVLLDFPTNREALALLASNNLAYDPNTREIITAAEYARRHGGTTTPTPTDTPPTAGTADGPVRVRISLGLNARWGAWSDFAAEPSFAPAELLATLLRERGVEVVESDDEATVILRAEASIRCTKLVEFLEDPINVQLTGDIEGAVLQPRPAGSGESLSLGSIRTNATRASVQPAVDGVYRNLMERLASSVAAIYE